MKLPESVDTTHTNMGSLKRKIAPGGNPPAKAAKSTKDSRPTRSSKDAKMMANEPAAPLPTQSVLSRMADDEPMFVRGGGSVLTPLEIRDIGKRARADAAAEAAEFDTRSNSAKAKAQAMTKERKSRKRTKVADAGDEARDGVKIEGLNFKVRCWVSC